MTLGEAGHDAARNGTTPHLTVIPSPAKLGDACTCGAAAGAGGNPQNAAVQNARQARRARGRRRDDSGRGGHGIGRRCQAGRIWETHGRRRRRKTVAGRHRLAGLMPKLGQPPSLGEVALTSSGTPSGAPWVCTMGVRRRAWRPAPCGAPPSPLRLRRRAWRPVPWGHPKGCRGRRVSGAAGTPGCPGRSGRRRSAGTLRPGWPPRPPLPCLRVASACGVPPLAAPDPSVRNR